METYPVAPEGQTGGELPGRLLSSDLGRLTIDIQFKRSGPDQTLRNVVYPERGSRIMAWSFALPANGLWGDFLPV